MKIERRLLPDLVVVDANCDEYDALAIALGERELEVRFYSTGGDALRAAGTFHAALWLVNIRLPDMTGVGLLKLIRQRMRRCSVMLVGDEYSPEDELAARLAGATAYVCKPASALCLTGVRARCRSPAIRAGPAPFS
jgi:DNA-binding response OmpR family regulator